MRSLADAVHLIQVLYYTFSLLDRRSRIRSAAASVSCIGAFLSLGAALAAAASSFRLGCTIHGLDTFGAFLDRQAAQRWSHHKYFPHKAESSRHRTCCALTPSAYTCVQSVCGVCICPSYSLCREVSIRYTSLTFKSPPLSIEGAVCSGL